MNLSGGDRLDVVVGDTGLNFGDPGLEIEFSGPPAIGAGEYLVDDTRSRAEVGCPGAEKVGSAYQFAVDDWLGFSNGGNHVDPSWRRRLAYTLLNSRDRDFVPVPPVPCVTASAGIAPYQVLDADVACASSGGLPNSRRNST